MTRRTPPRLPVLRAADPDDALSIVPEVEGDQRARACALAGADWLRSLLLTRAGHAARARRDHDAAERFFAASRRIRECAERIMATALHSKGGRASR